MATTADFRNGMCLRVDNDLKQIMEFQHVKPGKGAAFVRTKLKSLTTGKVIEHTFNAGQRVEPVRVERREYQFLYQDEMGLHFMNTEDFEQVTVQRDSIQGVAFLKEEQTLDLIFLAEEEKMLYGELPPFVHLRVDYTEPGVKGDTATNTLKPATLETGAEIKVPLFINSGEKIKVDTRNGAYVERVKE